MTSAEDATGESMATSATAIDCETDAGRAVSAVGRAQQSFCTAIESPQAWLIAAQQAGCASGISSAAARQVVDDTIANANDETAAAN